MAKFKINKNGYNVFDNTISNFGDDYMYAEADLADEMLNTIAQQSMPTSTNSQDTLFDTIPSMDVRKLYAPKANYYDILKLQNRQEDYNNFYKSPKQKYAQDAVSLQNTALRQIPENAQLSLFASSPEALSSYTNSDASTGATPEELQNLERQFLATSSTDDIAQYLINQPNLLTDLNSYTTSFDKSAQSLIQLYSMLRSKAGIIPLLLK